MKRKTRKALILVFFLAALVFGGLFINRVLEYRSAAKGYQALAEKYVSSVPQTPEAEGGEGENQIIYDEYAPIRVDFKALCAQNPDYRGWLWCEDTPINYPVMQDRDNNTYIHSRPDGSWDYAGSLFMDCRSAPDFSDYRTVIYGHNMMDFSMFGSLGKYRKQVYAETHDRLYLLTPDQNFRLEVLAGFYVPYNSPYYLNAESDEALQAFLQTARSKSAFPPMYQDKTYERLTCLSTCAYKGGRLMLVCGMVPVG